jgi:hypothetical protein
MTILERIYDGIKKPVVLNGLYHVCNPPAYRGDDSGDVELSARQQQQPFKARERS